MNLPRSCIDASRFHATATNSVFSLSRITNSLPSTACAGAAFRSLRLRNDPCRSGPPPHLLFRTSARPEEPKSFVERISGCLSPPFLHSGDPDTLQITTLLSE